MFTALIPALGLLHATPGVAQGQVFTFEADARTAFEVLRDGKGQSSFNLPVSTKVVVLYYAAVPRDMGVAVTSFAQSGKPRDLNIRTNAEPKLYLIVYDEAVHNPVIFAYDAAKWNERSSLPAKRIGLVALSSN